LTLKNVHLAACLRDNAQRLAARRTAQVSRPKDPAVIAAERGRFFASDYRPRPNDNAKSPPPARGPPADAFELERIITLAEAARLTGLSEDSIRRHYAHLILRLSPRRVGMKFRDAIAIGTAA
jgi:hypothetical protein